MPFSLDLYFILLNPNCEFTGKELVANFHKLATFTQNWAKVPNVVWSAQLSDWLGKQGWHDAVASVFLLRTVG